MDQLNDSLDDLIFGAGTDVRTSPVLQREAAQAYTKTAVELFTEPCKKCSGSGKFVGRNGRIFGNCFSCKGKGKFEFKASPEARAAARDQKAARKVEDQKESWTAFANHPENEVVAGWIEAQRATFDFAAQMYDTVVRFGDLTAGQRGAVERCADREAAAVVQRIERIQNAPQVDTSGIDRLKAAFDKAREYAAAKAPGLAIRNPKITIGGMTISPAKADSKNPGALYVKAGGTYLGKIQNGQFFGARECDEARKAQVLQFVADPAKAAKVYGQETGVCCVCNATLKSKWRLAGIGPVCAEKMGWAGLAEDFGGLPK